MRKKYILIFLGILIIALGITVGVLITKKNKEKAKEERLAYKNELDNSVHIVTTDAKERKTTPNTILIFKTYYKNCGHTIEKKEKISEELVNKTEDEIRKAFAEWQIEKFLEEEVVLSKEKEEVCEEHYILRDNKGYISIYTQDSEGNEKMQETTDIVTAYLPDTDRKELEDGIKIIGKENLNKRLEDFE